MIPATEGGLLPPGLHRATWEELTLRFGMTDHRSDLLEGLLRAARELRRCGCSTLYVDGSFVTDKDVPNDFDGSWDAEAVDLDALDPVLLTFDDKRALQKAVYLGELFPADAAADDVGRTFLEFFQVDKVTGAPKGIVVIDLGTLPG